MKAAGVDHYQQPLGLLGNRSEEPVSEMGGGGGGAGLGGAPRRSRWNLPGKDTRERGFQACACRRERRVVRALNAVLRKADSIMRDRGKLEWVERSVPEMARKCMLCLDSIAKDWTECW